MRDCLKILAVIMAFLLSYVAYAGQALPDRASSAWWSTARLAAPFRADTRFDETLPGQHIVSYR